jgi:hypothetical protein
MNNKIESVLSLASGVSLLIIWYVYLFVAIPENTTLLSAASNGIEYALSPEKNENYLFFWFTLISICVSFYCCFAFLFKASNLSTMVLVAAHTAASLFVYDFGVVIATALPLLYVTNHLPKA